MKCSGIIANGINIPKTITKGPIKTKIGLAVTALSGLTYIPYYCLKDKESKNIDNIEEYKANLKIFEESLYSNEYNLPRFNKQEIEKLGNLYCKKPKLIARLISEKTSIEKEGEIIDWRFNYNQIETLYQLSEENEALVGKLIDVKAPVSQNATNKFPKPKFCTSEIKLFVNKSKKINPTILNSIIEKTYIPNHFLSNVLNLAESRPDKYLEIDGCGFFNLIRDGVLDENILNFINQNIYISAPLVNAIKKMTLDEPDIKTLPKNTKPEATYGLIPDGEIYEIDNQLYLNYADDKGNKHYTPLKLSKEKVNELFPLYETSNVVQGKIGDCWIIAVLDTIMELPYGKASIINLFEEDGKDIIVKFPNKKQKIRFKNGKTGTLENGLKGAEGLKMIEQAFLIYESKKLSKKADEIVVQDIPDLGKYASKIDGGLSDLAITSLLGYNTTLMDFIKDTLLSSEDKYKEKLIKQAANSKDLVTYTAFRKDPKIDFEKEMEEYNILANHCYGIKGYNEKRGTLILTNPHVTGVTIEVPLAKVYDYMSHYGMIKFRY